MWKWVFLQAVVLRIETGEEGGKEERRQSHAGCLFPWSRTHKTGEDLHFSLFFCERLSTWGGLSVNNRIIFSLATFRSWVFCWVDFFFFSFFFFLFLSRSTAKFLMRFLMSYWWENVKWFLVTVHSSPVMPPRSRLLFFCFFFLFNLLIYRISSSQPSRLLCEVTCSQSDSFCLHRTEDDSHLLLSLWPFAHVHTHFITPTLSKPRHCSRSPLEPDEILTPVLVC